ncbi:MAG: hypothetical protein KKF89_03490 [Nanoarchaeota archaeon]|nr:hypothetical protein [Nanoarchaeota archaeon]MBU1854759.1 hypothetical protein [Nanoarchaeota archaeon]
MDQKLRLILTLVFIVLAVITLITGVSNENFGGDAKKFLEDDPVTSNPQLKLVVDNIGGKAVINDLDSSFP